MEVASGNRMLRASQQANKECDMMAGAQLSDYQELPKARMVLLLVREARSAAVRNEAKKR